MGDRESSRAKKEPSKVVMSIHSIGRSDDVAVTDADNPVGIS